MIFPSLFQDLCDMLVANRLFYPKSYDLAYNSLSVILALILAYFGVNTDD